MGVVHHPLGDSIRDLLGQEIVSGIRAAGTVLTLEEIGSRFAVSRTVAREAMRGLEHLGLVRTSRRVGIVVQERSQWSLFDPAIIEWRLRSEKTRAEQLASLRQLRQAVEPVAAYAAATAATAQSREELVHLAGRLVALETTPSRKVGEYLSTDLQFHSLILRSSGNEMFAALAGPLTAMVGGKSVYGSAKRDPTAGTAAAHVALADAIAAGRGTEAQQLARRILEENRV